MSPLFVPITLAISVGVVFLVIGFITRKKVLVIIGAPAAALVLVWFVIASLPPDPNQEFDRIFGKQNRKAAANIDTIKPSSMDGHFISFSMPQSEFNARIRSKFEGTVFTHFHLLRNQKLPAGWPDSVSDATESLRKELNHQEILVYYDQATETAYASVLYCQW